MKLSEHMARGLFVAWSFIMGDKSQLKFLEISENGAVRSFSALLFCMPLFFLINFFQFVGVEFEWFFLIHILVLFLGYAIAWIVFAGIIRFAYSIIGPQKNYYAYLTLYNWARVYVLLLVIPSFVFINFINVSGYFKDVIVLTTLIIVFFYKYRITRATLLMPVAQTILFILFDMVLLLLVDAVFFEALAFFQ